jgi:hypothetical protein
MISTRCLLAPIADNTRLALSAYLQNNQLRSSKYVTVGSPVIPDEREDCRLFFSKALDRKSSARACRSAFVTTGKRRISATERISCAGIPSAA